MTQPKINYHEWESIYRLCQMIDVWGRNRQIRGIAAGIISAKTPAGDWKVPENDHIGIIKAVYDWVNKSVRYTPDPIKIDIFEDPLTTLGLKIADCDGYVVLIGSLLQSLGFPVVVVMTAQLKNERLTHVFLLIGIPPSNPLKDIRAWIPVDAITNQPVTWQPPYAWGIFKKV